MLANAILRRIDGKARAEASPAPTMTRLGRFIRVMVGVLLAGTHRRQVKDGSERQPTDKRDFCEKIKGK